MPYGDQVALLVAVFDDEVGDSKGTSKGGLERGKGGRVNLEAEATNVVGAEARHLDGHLGGLDVGVGVGVGVGFHWVEHVLDRYETRE